MVHWLRMQVLGMQVPGSNSGKVFSTLFVHLITCGDCSIRVSQSCDFTFCFITLVL